MGSAFSGVAAKSNITAGVPRLRELIDVSKKQKNPFLIINIKDSGNKQQAEAIKNQLRNTKLHEFVDKVQVIYDPDINKSNIEEDRKFISDYFKYTIGLKQPGTLSHWVIRFELNRTKMVYNQMRMNIIRRRLNSFPEFFAVTTDDNAPTLILRVHLVVANLSDKNPRNVDQVLKQKDRLMNDLVLRGIDKLTSVQVREHKVKEFDKSTGEVVTSNQYYLDTDGTNLVQVLKHPGVDIVKTRSTDVLEVYNVFGIEAARRTLLTEIRQVLTFNGTYVNYHHLALLVDIMTHTGDLTAISRHGFNRLDKSPISKSSFEETVEQLKIASMNQEEDNMRSVSARVMFGQAIMGGTGASKLIIDESAYGATEEQIDDIMDNL